MASSLALKRFASSNLLPRYFSALRPSAAASQSASRLFNTNASRYSDSEDDDDRGADVDHRSGHSAFRFRSPGVVDVFSPLSDPKVLNAFPWNSPFAAASRGLRQGWAAKEAEDALHLRIDMPGLGKEHVKVSVEQNTLVVKGEGKMEEEEDERKFARRIDLPEKLYKLDQIKAEMKNGVLKVVVPKLKEEERSDVVHVKVE